MDGEKENKKGWRRSTKSWRFQLRNSFWTPVNSTTLDSQFFEINLGLLNEIKPHLINIYSIKWRFLAFFVHLLRFIIFPSSILLYDVESVQY